MDLGCVNGGLWTVEVAGVLGLLIVLQNLQMIGLWCFFFFGSGMYYFIVVDILFYYDVYIILLS